MSEARDRYNNLKDAEPFDLMHICMAADRLIIELEQQKAELMEFIKLVNKTSGNSSCNDYAMMGLYEKSSKILEKYTGGE